jgi:2-keto-4-pentenoate hydratase/2-oxohepta-3-ene-1,7-dioic acid hydratase in catechol pathway
VRAVRFAPPDGVEVWYGLEEAGAVVELDAPAWAPHRRTGRAFAIGEVRLHAPVVPGVVIGIGKNFVAEGQPVPAPPEIPILFFKPPSTVIGPGEPIALPRGGAAVTFESELAVVIGRRARNVSAEDVFDYVYGFTVANDLSAPEFHHPEGHWTISKAFDGFCPLGPAIETDLDLGAVRVEAFVNGERRQSSGLDRMITGIAPMIAYISGFMTLSPGDVILTGTPAGAGPVGEGDTVECVIEGIGRLLNDVQRP